MVKIKIKKNYLMKTIENYKNLQILYNNRIRTK